MYLYYGWGFAFRVKKGYAIRDLGENWCELSIPFILIIVQFDESFIYGVKSLSQDFYINTKKKHQ
jgi:hypothetical protein